MELSGTELSFFHNYLEVGPPKTKETLHYSTGMDSQCIANSYTFREKVAATLSTLFEPEKSAPIADCHVDTPNSTWLSWCSLPASMFFSNPLDRGNNLPAITRWGLYSACIFGIFLLNSGVPRPPHNITLITYSVYYWSQVSR